LTEAFGEMKYWKVVHVLSERVAKEYGEKAANESNSGVEEQQQQQPTDEGQGDTQQAESSQENASVETESTALSPQQESSSTTSHDLNTVTTINGAHPLSILRINELESSSPEIRLIHQQKALLEVDRMCGLGPQGVQRLVSFGIIPAIVDCCSSNTDPLIRLLSVRCLARILRLSYWAREQLANDEQAFFEVYDSLLQVLSASENDKESLTIPSTYECSIELRKSVFDSHFDCVRYVVRALAVLARHPNRGHMLNHLRKSEAQSGSSTQQRPTIIDLLVNRVLKKYYDGVVLIEALYAILAYVSTHASARQECLQYDIMTTLASFLRVTKSPDSTPFKFRHGPKDVHDDDFVNHPLLPNEESKESVNRPFVSSPPYTLMNLVAHTAACIATLANAKEGTKAAVAVGIIDDLVYWMDMRHDRIRESVACALMYLTLDIRGKREAFQEDIALKLRELIANKNERSATKLYLLRVINAMSDLPEARQQLRSISAYLKTMRSTDEDRAELREALDECYEKAYACVTFSV